MIPPIVYRCWTVPARVVRAVPRVARRHVWRPVRHYIAHHAVAVAVVAIPATVVCVAVPGWYALSAPPVGVEGGGAPLVWYPGGGGFGGAPGGFGSPVGGAPGGFEVGGGPGGEIGGCCGTEEERRHHHHHHVEHEKPPVRIPEPSSLALFGMGAVMTALLRRKKVQS